MSALSLIGAGIKTVGITMTNIQIQASGHGKLRHGTLEQCADTPVYCVTSTREGIMCADGDD